MAGPEAKKKTSTRIFPDWSQLPEELLHLISTHLEDHCFDVIHARSVCTSWRSTFPFPSSLIRQSYSLPSFDEYPSESKGFFTFKKVPLFLFRVRAANADAAEYFLGGIGQDESEDHMELHSPLQCLMKVMIPGSEPSLMNMLDCQILSLGYQYRIIGWNWKQSGVAILPLNKEGFIVLFNRRTKLLLLTSVEMRWKQLSSIVPTASCMDVVTFRGKFYATFFPRDIVTIDPYSLEVTIVMPLPKETVHFMIPSGDDELFLVEVIRPTVNVSDISNVTCRVSRLDEKAGKWVVVSDLGDRVLFIGQMGKFSCLAKELPHGCGLSGNSIFFTNLLGDVTFPYKYGVQTGNAGDDLNCWRSLRENPMKKLNTSFPVITLRVER